MYKLYKCGINLQSEGVMFIGENSVTSIPFDQDNTDYQAYLAWVEQGNEPLPAEGTE